MSWIVSIESFINEVLLRNELRSAYLVFSAVEVGVDNPIFLLFALVDRVKKFEDVFADKFIISIN